MLIQVPAHALSLDVSTQYSYDVEPLLAAHERVRLVGCFFALLFGADLPKAPGSAPATVIDNARCADRCGDPLSATCAVNADVPALVGVPAIDAGRRVQCQTSGQAAGHDAPGIRRRSAGRGQGLRIRGAHASVRQAGRRQRQGIRDADAQ